MFIFTIIAFPDKVNKVTYRVVAAEEEEALAKIESTYPEGLIEKPTILVSVEEIGISEYELG